MGQATSPRSFASGFATREWVLVGLLLLAFAPAVLALAGEWSRVDYQSHGFLVPVVSIWVALRERPRWNRLVATPDRGGVLALVAALGAYATGVGIGSVSLQGVALVGAVAGVVLFTRGREWLRALAFPVAYLLFMVPAPPAWITPAIVKLQLFVSSASVTLLGAFGLGVTRDGNVLRLPDGGALFVAEACSGVTSIVTLVPIAVLFGYLTLRRLGTRVALVIAVVPLAMLGNLARVLVTCVAADRYGVARATSGLFHESAGLLTYVVACGLLLVLGAGLRRLEA